MGVLGAGASDWHLTIRNLLLSLSRRAALCILGGQLGLDVVGDLLIPREFHLVLTGTTRKRKRPNTERAVSSSTV